MTSRLYDSTFHVTEVPALTTRPSVTSQANKQAVYQALGNSQIHFIYCSYISRKAHNFPGIAVIVMIYMSGKAEQFCHFGCRQLIIYADSACTVRSQIPCLFVFLPLCLILRMLQSHLTVTCITVSSVLGLWIEPRMPAQEVRVLLITTTAIYK